ncbi:MULTISPECIES: carbohydrate ABC transporter permease [Arthrobacter]|uniref:Sugar ABC transporter permease n=1 Tax=Arthrobacter terricola TaxID=2547396 RepID=A0A4R5KEE7_9MICC|nr:MULTISPECIES: sugar ABC transporter permease [Arthrobacter]MBT8159656.1 sugar ABC transporter permease [Arthrobacter sp. GN70]TDF93613.1 sugar ABC transporter permease [Arthrobacter terricola]
MSQQITLPQTTKGVEAPTERRPRRRRGGSMNLMYVPAIAMVAIFMIYPLVQGVGLAFTNWDGYSPTKAFVGFDNFARLFNDKTFLTALINTLIYGVGCTVLQQIIGLALAVALDGAGRSKAFARALIYLPVLVSPVVMSMMYYFLFQYDRGALNDILVALGFDRIAWLSTGPGTVTIVVLINTLQFVGISMVIYLAGLQGIGQEINEAAEVDGARGLRLFRSITLPLLRPAIISSMIINLIGGLKLYDVVQVLTGGGPGYSSHSVSTLIARSYFGQQAAGYASAMGVALFVLIAVVSIFLVTRMDRTGKDI